MVGILRLISYCFLIAGLCPLSATAQIKSKIEHYSTEDGLSHDGVMSILKDRDGFMWFGTWDGINRFDGHNFVTYKTRPGDRSSLKINRVDNIKEDSKGYLWLEVYDNQVYRFDKKTKKFLAISDILSKQNIKNVLFNGIVMAGNDLVWLTTASNGIFAVRNTPDGSIAINRYSTQAEGSYRLPSNKINFIYGDAQHNVWIGTGGGLKCISTAKGISKDQPLHASFAKGIHYTQATEVGQIVWLGTNDGELVSFNRSTQQFSRKKLAHFRLNGLKVAASKKVMYVTAGSSVITVDLNSLKSVVSTISGKGHLLSIYEDRSGLLWLEPEKHGLIKFDPLKRTFKYFFQENDANFIITAREYKVFEDHNNRVWMSMKGGGFGYYNPAADAIEYFYNKPGSSDHLFSNTVTSSYFDPAGILWLCTRDRGIDKVIFQANDFRHHLVKPYTLNKSDNEIRGIYSDRNKQLWLASKAGGLYVYRNGKQLQHVFINEPKNGIGLVYTMLQDKAGNVWLGTKGNGLFKAAPVDKSNAKFRLTHYKSNRKDPNSLSSDLVYSLLEDRKGRVWIATYEYGINLLVQDGDQVKFLNSINSFKKYPPGSLKARHLQEGPDGRLWIATTSGVLIADTDKGAPDNYAFKNYGKVPGDSTSLGNNDAQYIYRDSKGRMWVATSGGGLNKVVSRAGAGLKFKAFTKEDGLPSDYILSIIEDDRHYLWLGTENGISKLDPERLHFKNYDSYDGLPKTGLSEASALKLSDGTLLFGCINGYLTFNPATMTGRKIKAKMVLTSFQVNNREMLPAETGAPLTTDINDAGRVDLKYNENIISLDFTVLDYRSGNKQLYAYRLKGFDKGWHSVKNQRKATYTNLPAGSYVFEVKSLNTDMYENVPLKTLDINIAPPLWRTVWAYLLYALLLGVLIEVARRIITTMIRLRNRITVEQRLTELKLSFFTNISHELRTPLTLIVNPIEEIARQEDLSPKGLEYINVVRRNANRMVRFINQLLDFRKAQSGKMNLNISHTDVVALVHEIAAYFSEIAREKHIQLQVTSNVKELYAWIDAEKIDIVLYNLLSNAFKFSPDNRSISIEIDQQAGSGSFRLSVVDMGIGVPADKLIDIFELYHEVDKEPGNNLEGTGIGLALCKEIVQYHHGEIEARNNEGVGLTVIVTLKCGKEHFREGTHILTDKSITLPPVMVNPERADEVQPRDKTAEIRENLPLVLVVDDNNELRKFLVDQLKDYYRVVEAKDGQEGLDFALKFIPDLILSDVMMPVLDGIQLLDRLKNNIVSSHIPVILLTAKSSVENQIEGLKYGADFYITKPFQTDLMLASIGNLLKQRKKLFEALLDRKKTITLGPGEIFITSKDEVFLKELIEIVEQGMVDAEFNIDTVAESIGMGRSTFYKKLKSLTNIAPVEFVREMRLKRAKQLLDAGGQQIAEIAYSVGFNSAKYFSTCFKEAYGISPSEYLKSKPAESDSPDRGV